MTPKVKVTSPKPQFQPIKLEITLDTENDLREFIRDYNNIREDTQINYDFVEIKGSYGNIFNIIAQLVKQQSERQ